MNRREFLFTAAAGAATRLSASPTPRIDLAGLQADLTALSAFGRPVGGTFQDGVSRVGYSDADIAGRKFVIRLFEEAGARVRVDAAGNIFAARAGTDDTQPPVLFGSHIDSV